MTQMPAQRMHYRDRGVVKSGAFADLLVFDLDKIGDHATFDDAKQLSTGMDLVFVNGQMAWKDEIPLARAGISLN